MATDFTQESVLGFLRCNGGRVRNAELLAHFKYFLRDVDICVQNRELFKKFVNAVAVVKHEDGVSYVVLRKKFKLAGGDVASSHTHKHQEERQENPRAKQRERSPRRDINPNRERRVPGEPSPHVPRFQASVGDRAFILPAAGIVNNNNNVKMENFEKTTRRSLSQSLQNIPPLLVVTKSGNANHHSKPLLTPPFSSDSKRSSGSGQSFEESLKKGPTDLEQRGVDIKNLGHSREPDGCSTPPPDYLHQDMGNAPMDMRQTLEQQQFHPHSREWNTRVSSIGWPPINPLSHTSRIANSSPCITENFTSPPTRFKDHISVSNDCLISPERQSCYHINESPDIQATTSSMQRRSLPLDPVYNRAVGAESPFQDLHRTPLSSTHDSLTGTEVKWPFELGKGAWSSEDSMSRRVPEGCQANRVEQMLQHARQANLLSQLDQPQGANIPSYHRSTGHLGLEAPGCYGGTDLGSSPDHLLRPPGHRRMSQRDRSRISRSLGAGLDQPFPEDNEMARHNRLLLLSSSLSLNHPVASTTPPRVPSSMDVSLSGASSTASLSPGNLDRAFLHRSSAVPLDPREHEWMVRAASAEWSEIYSLFREDHNLLEKRDFISGYTVLHWIAQHGDHRVLNTLWYGVNKVGKMLEVDAKTNCGYTPLHLAAMYGHKKLVRLLVHKFKADVRLRDTSGRRAWQYLDTDSPKDLLELLGAPQKKHNDAPSPQAHTSKATRIPANISATVKRHASLAALFKHKSLGRIVGHTEMAV